jgi:flagellar hook-basal body complex protein FliE
MTISPISTTKLPLAQTGEVRPGPQTAIDKLGQTFATALDGLNATQLNSDQLIARLAAGEDVDIHTVMIAAEQTEVAFRVAVAMRDQLVQAYQEMLRIQV